MKRIFKYVFAFQVLMLTNLPAEQAFSKYNSPKIGSFDEENTLNPIDPSTTIITFDPEYNSDQKEDELSGINLGDLPIITYNPDLEPTKSPEDSIEETIDPNTPIIIYNPEIKDPKESDPLITDLGEGIREKRESKTETRCTTIVVGRECTDNPQQCPNFTGGLCSTTTQTCVTIYGEVCNDFQVCTDTQ